MMMLLHHKSHIFGSNHAMAWPLPWKTRETLMARWAPLACPMVPKGSLTPRFSRMVRVLEAAFSRFARSSNGNGQAVVNNGELITNFMVNSGN